MSAEGREEKDRGSLSTRWEGHGDLLRTTLQETGRLRLAFLTLADVYAACDDIGVDPRTVEFRDGYAVANGQPKTMRRGSP